MPRRKIRTSKTSQITRATRRRSKCKTTKKKTRYIPHDPLYSQLRKAGIKSPQIIRSV